MEAPRDYEVLWVLLRAVMEVIDQAPVLFVIAVAYLGGRFLLKPGRW